MKLYTLIVLYNPTSIFLDHFAGYFSFSDKVLFIDNSDKINIKDQLLSLYPQAVYISLSGNQGIAKALKTGMNYSIKDKADYVLTMDQDTVFPFNRINEIKDIISSHPEYGLLGLNFNSSETSLEIQNVPWWLTSGNFINVSNYASLKKGFNEDLFIDSVDADLCHSFYSQGYKIGYIKGISITQTMGKPKVYKFGFISFTALNYTPIRYYYMFRNNYYLYHQDKKFYRKTYQRLMWFTKPKILFFEDNKKANRKAIRLGIKDAKKGILGKCPHSL
jgi:rhamnosyltransferase